MLENLRTNKAFAIGLFVFAILLVGFMGWYYFMRTPGGGGSEIDASNIGVNEGLEVNAADGTLGDPNAADGTMGDANGTDAGGAIGENGPLPGGANLPGGGATSPEGVPNAPTGGGEATPGGEAPPGGDQPQPAPGGGGAQPAQPAPG